MITFGLMAALTVLALFLLLRPWWRGDHARLLGRREANIVAYRTRLAEIETDAASGLLNAEQAEALRQELAQRLLADADSLEPERTVAPTTSVRRYVLPLLLVIALSAFAALWYFAGDSWRTQQTIALVATHPEQAQTLMVQAMVERLENRLKKTPDDAEGWAMLGRSYFVTQRYAEAAKAYAKANAVDGSQTADWLVGEGESQAMAQDRDLDGLPAQRFAQALKLDPDSGKALWYAGLAAAQTHDYATALKYWLHLREQPLPPDLATALDQRLQELAKLSGQKIPDATKATEATAVSLHVNVSLAAALKDKVPAGATLFVFAKAAAGPPMPLAVQKLSAWQLPVEITLDDSMSMMPALRLSQFDHWVLTARISTGGGPQAQAGDLQGQLQVQRADASQPVSLVISEIVK